MTNHHALIKHRRRKDRAARTAWAALIETPHDLATGMAVPARGRLGISHSVGLTAGQVTVSFFGGRRLFSHPALDADQIHKFDSVEKGSFVTVSGVPTGTLSLWLIDALDGSNVRVIATLVVA